MPTLVEYFNRQSKSANWFYTDQLYSSDGTPLWGSTLPTITMSLVGRDAKPLVVATTDDGTDQLTVDADGIMNVNVIPNSLNAFDEGMYDVRLKIVIDGFTVDRAYGRLPLSEGS